jgi:hypothetical protein
MPYTQSRSIFIYEGVTFKFMSCVLALALALLIAGAVLVSQMESRTCAIPSAQTAQPSSQPTSAWDFTFCP